MAGKQRSWMQSLGEFWFPLVVTALWFITAAWYVIGPYESEKSKTEQSTAAKKDGPAGKAAPDKSALTQSPADEATQAKAASAEASKREQLKPEFKFFAMLAAVLAAVWFVYCFTGNPYEQRTQSVIFAYFFVLASFAVLCIPPFVKKAEIGGEPMGILSGCLKNSGPVDIAKELACEKTVADPNKPPPDPKVPAPKPQWTQWVVSIGGSLDSGSCTVGKDCDPLGSPGNRAVITGGAVVPLYFVIFALMGAAISLSRRIPEIQKRSEDDYQGTATEPKLQAGEVREMLAFQILQFVSAPLIAITAYHAIHPDTHTASAALAFMSGFGSETVLLMIRGIVSGIKPQSVTPSGTGVLSGKVTKAGQGVAGIEIQLAGTKIKATTDGNGQYLLRDVGAGSRDLVVRHRGHKGKVTATVVAGQTTTVDIPVAETGSVKGVVKDAAQKEVKDAKVWIDSDASDDVKTDAKGAFDIDFVTVGNQELNVEHPKGKVTKTTVTVTAGQPTVQNVNLP